MNLPIYVLNLDSNPGRMEKMHEQLKKLELPYERIAAIDGSKLTKDHIYKYYPGWRGIVTIERPLLRGEIGCFLSHCHIHKKIIANTSSVALILEDDVVLSEAFVHFLRNVDKLPSGFQMVNFIYNKYPWIVETPEGTPIIEGCRLTVFQSKEDIKSSKTTAYLITKSACSIALDNAYPIKGPIDDYLYSPNLSKLTAVYGVETELVKIAPIASTIWAQKNKQLLAHPNPFLNALILSLYYVYRKLRYLKWYLNVKIKMLLVSRISKLKVP